MEYWTYILKSSSSGKHYCGQTGDLNRRLREHNDAERSGVKWTRRTEGDWMLIWSKASETRSEAMQLERKIKARGIERYLQDIQPAESRQGRD